MGAAVQLVATDDDRRIADRAGQQDDPADLALFHAYVRRVMAHYAANPAKDRGFGYGYTFRSERRSPDGRTLALPMPAEFTRKIRDFHAKSERQFEYGVYNATDEEEAAMGRLGISRDQTRGAM